MPTAEAKTWRGAKGLRRLLVPVGDVRPFPGNPRIGDVASIKESLERFGQTKPILADQDGQIVAGNHTHAAAVELGWSHIAVTVNEFADEQEARAYLIADNHLPDRGRYDDQQLVAMLNDLKEAGSLAGTGYSESDVDAAARDLARDLARINEQAPPEFPEINPDDMHVDYCCPSCGYGWSGAPRPSRGAEAEPEPDAA